MPAQFFAAVLVMTKLVALKNGLMTADYRGDVAQLASLRTDAEKLGSDRRLGYLADYWSGFASWRIVVNAMNDNMKPDAARAELTRAAAAFESSIAKKSDFADSYAADAAVHGWLAALSKSDPAAMNAEIEIFKKQIKRAAELEPNNPRVLWIEAVPYAVLPPERGGNLDHAVELYREMVVDAKPLDAKSPLPDWGKAEAMMSIANADLRKSSPDVDGADVEAHDALRLQPEWHYVKDILLPQIDTTRRTHAFDYLLGDWEFTATSQQYGQFHGVWSAVRLDNGNIFDEYRVTGDKGETYYVTRTLRSYNARTKEWELVSTDNGGGLQNAGTAHRDGDQMLIEQKFAATSDKPVIMRIRYYNIRPDAFSWAADRSTDDGKTWAKDFQTIEAKRVSAERPFTLTHAPEVQH